MVKLLNMKLDFKGTYLKKDDCIVADVLMDENGAFEGILYNGYNAYIEGRYDIKNEFITFKALSLNENVETGNYRISTDTCFVVHDFDEKEPKFIGEYREDIEEYDREKELDVYLETLNQDDELVNQDEELVNQDDELVNQDEEVIKQKIEELKYIIKREKGFLNKEFKNEMTRRRSINNSTEVND